MKAGIIITNTGEIKTGLKYFRCELWEAGEVRKTNVFLAHHEIIAVNSAISVFATVVTWLSGQAATKKIAKLAGLRYRERAPGAGRPPLDDKDKVKQVGLWMTQGGIDEMRRQVKASRPKRTNGQHFERLLTQNALNVV